MPHIELRLYGNTDKNAIIDADDAELAGQYKWYLRNGYACTAVHRAGSKKGEPGRSINISLHRFLLGARRGDVVDHISGDRLDNRRSNLRFVTHRQNSLNRTLDRCASGFIGVVQDPRDGAFSVMVDGVYFGRYKDPALAGKVYDRVATTLRPGEIFPVNFADSDLPDDFRIVNFNTDPRKARLRSSVPGVSWVSSPGRAKRWRAILKKKTLGYFHTEAEAISCLEAVR